MRFLRMRASVSAATSNSCCNAPYALNGCDSGTADSLLPETLPSKGDHFLRRADMDEPLPDGGVIRKLWVGETDAYRDHLLRLDRESRNRRFSGGGFG
jgi:hypothetical protein